MITKLGIDYLITEKGTNGRTLSIYAYVNDLGITLKDQTDENTEFEFINSKPEMVAKIGGMIRKVGLKAMKGKI